MPSLQRQGISGHISGHKPGHIGTLVTENLHLQKRPDTGRYRYVRRVPVEVQQLVGEKLIKVGLKTTDLATATQKARELNVQYDTLWKALAAGVKGDEIEQRKAAIALVRSMGFGYRKADDLLASERDLLPRLHALEQHLDQPQVARALLGTAAEPSIAVSGLFNAYMKYKADDLVGYSTSQLRKHKLPKQRAAKYLEEAIGDKQLSDMTRDDALEFREWWEKKRKAENLTVDAPNRSFTDIQGMIAVVDTAMKTNYREIWGGLRFKGTKQTRSKKRGVFAPDFIQNEMLKPGRLDDVTEQARLIFYVLIETGARPSEICNLQPARIHLDAEIPHIEIEEDDRILKSDNAVRTIPLVGCALWAMKKAPKGFPSYQNNEDSFSATMNKALKRLGLRPTPRHVVYSLRHSFQDRIQAAGASDRLQTDLMGHEFGRPKYGDGAAMAQKLELLDRIKFKW